jgi:hypothetical protein
MEKNANVNPTSYRVSDRVVLSPGDRFRASGGPYYEIQEADGSIAKSRMRDRGPYTFIEYSDNNGSPYIVARSRDGTTVLNLGPVHRHPLLPKLVKAPYRNIRKVGRTKRERAMMLKVETPCAGEKQNQSVPTQFRRHATRKRVA